MQDKYLNVSEQLELNFKDKPYSIRMSFNKEEAPNKSSVEEIQEAIRKNCSEKTFTNTQWDFSSENESIITDEEKQFLDKFFKQHPELKQPSTKEEIANKKAEDLKEFYKNIYKDEYALSNNSIKINTLQNENWIQSYTGQRFNPINPDPSTINIEDIAHALSNICRFTGHSSVFYSVAEHSVLTSYICDYKNRLTLLLHDGSEAYLSDIASPVKKSSDFERYREIENILQTAIYKRFGINSVDEDDVRRADLMLLATEARDLMAPLRFDWVQPMKPLPFKIVPLPPQEAKRLFMQRFVELINA